MAYLAKQIIIDIDRHIQKSYKTHYQDFYIGITNDINRRLFGEHNVPVENYRYIAREAINEESARLVETHYLKKGMTGGEGGGNGDGSARFVYCYEISSTTKQ